MLTNISEFIKVPIDIIVNTSMTSPTKIYYVYKITNDFNNMEYVGFHSTTNLDDGYMGSGKRIIEAIKTHGVEHFKKEIIKTFTTKAAAEKLESDIVNIDYVRRLDTYNISIGGNVCILYGEDNGFYGKKHTAETRTRISASIKKYYETHVSKLVNRNWSITDDVIINDIRFNSLCDAGRKLKLTKLRLLQLLLIAGNGCVDLNQQDKIKAWIENYETWREINHTNWLINVSEAAKQPDRCAKIAKGVKTWIKNNPDKHQARMLKINTDPEKIEKTANKHRGMRRSAATKRKLSIAKRKYFNTHDSRCIGKGMRYIHNTITGEKRRVDKSTVLPAGWMYGFGKLAKPRASNANIFIFNELLNVERLISKNDALPEGWRLGRRRKHG